MCFSLHITPEKVNGWQYSFANFSIFNSIHLSILLYFYIAMLKIIYKSRLINKEQYKFRMQKMLKISFIIILTNLICFQPISILGKFKENFW